METELSDSVDGQLGSESACSSKEEIQEHFNRFINTSDIAECNSDDLASVSAESLQLKQSQKSVILAKKRLLAYTSNCKASIVKEDKHAVGYLEYADKQSKKKSKKGGTAYDTAKAVIQDIEELKRAGFGGKQTNLPLSMEAASVINIKAETKVYFTGAEDDRLFKKREIKCRNIRKSQIDLQPMSPTFCASQKNDNQNIKRETKQYPKNWREYIDLNLTPEKDAYLKSKLFKKPREKDFNLKQYFNFETPSAPIEIYRCNPINGDPIWIPYSYLRATIVQPQIIYSTNHKNTNSGYLRKDQLFSLITPNRREQIEQLYETSLKAQPEKKISIRKWYPKNWKKFDHSEGKLLETSIGLSFLQTYSDEEEDNTEDDENSAIVKDDGLAKEDGLYTPPLDVINTNSSISTTPDLKEKVTNTENKVNEVQQYVDINEWNISKITDIELSAQETESIEDEYIKTKKELEKLEAALRKNKKYLDEKDKKNRLKKDISSSDEKNTIKRNKTKKMKSKKEKRRDKVLSDTNTDTSDSEKQNKSKKRKKKDKKDMKRKEARKVKKHKVRKRRHTDDDSEETIDSDFSDDSSSSAKLNKTKSDKCTEDLLKTPPEILPLNSHDSLEEDIKYFTNRFSQERIRGKYKYVDDVSENITNKHKDFINLEELVCSNENIKIDNDKPKSEYKVDLLKKNEEYLKNQERQRMEQKRYETKDVVLTGEDEETRQSTSLIESSTLSFSEIKTHENEPDWEEIKNKRKKHIFDKNRHSDQSKSLSPVSSKIDESIDVIIKQESPCSKDSPTFNESKKPIFTKHFSSSWESDEEPLEVSSRNDRLETKTRESSFSFEIPLNIKHFTRRDIKFDPDRFDLNLKTVNVDMDNSKLKRKNDNVSNTNECNISKRKRWDIQLPDTVLNLSSVKVEKSDDMLDFNETNTESQDKLEDEYEEFLKAVTSTKKSHQTEISTNNVQFEQNTSPLKSVVTNLDELISNVSEAKSILDNSSIQSTLLNEQSGPGPVPSPKIETVLDFNKPLINLSLSANVTQNITLSLATTATNISAPITSTIDIAKTSLKIINNPPDVIDKEDNVETLWSKTDDSTTEPTKCGLNNFHSVIDSAHNPSKQKILFTSLTLPSKKQLVNTSLLNLDESDDEDISLLEEKKRKKLEAHIEDNKREIAEQEKIIVQGEEKPKLSKSPDKSKSANLEEKRESSQRTKHESLKRRRSPIKKRNSPSRKRSPGKRRSPRRSPRRRSPRRRSPFKRSASPLRKRKSTSPRRRRSPSPRRRRTISPNDRSPKRRTSPSFRSKRSTPPRKDRSKTENLHKVFHSPNIKRSKSPSLQEVSSSLDELKCSVADSTINDDQLPESTTNDDFNETAEEKTNEHQFDSPRRISLDDRINQVLGYDSVSQSSPKTITSTYNYNTPPPNYQYNEQYVHTHVGSPSLGMQLQQQSKRTSQSCYRQVGNMLQIVPSEDIMDIPMPAYNHNQNIQDCTNAALNYQQPPPRIDVKPQILQVGNMLHIVPTEIVPTEMILQNMQQEIKQEIEHITVETQLHSNEKPSAESALLQKVAERRAEREKRRQEKENRRKEKEQRRMEKQKARTDRLKVHTENLIKKALEMEQEEGNETVSDVFEEKQVQWPPPLINHSKEAAKGILLKSGSKKIDDLIIGGKRIKTVQFADGIRPGEGTSPSAGEELSSPPPPKSKLPKEKRYKKTKFHKKTAKKKVKVKVIKKPVQQSEESDSEDNLPPPSPPPGSPPPHIFPPRIKVNSVNNVPAPYLTTIMQNPSQQQPPQPQQQYQSNMYRSTIGLLMAPPPPLQGHAPGPSPVVQTLSTNRIAVSPVSTSHHASQTHYPPPSPSTPNNSHHHHHSLGPFGHSRHY